MRKLVFSALACVAFAGSGFAANEVVKLRNIEEIKELEIIESSGKPCNVYVWVQTPDGKKEWRTGEGGSLSWYDCGSYKDKFLQGLREEGLKFSDEDISVTWG